MYLLALESSAKSASAALAQDGRILASMMTDNGKTHSEQLLPMVENCLCRAGITYDQIDAFACTVGPGSFTGVRIGVSLLKGLAFGMNKPCIPVSTLRAIAEGLRPLHGIYCAVMDARRAQVYTALFRTDEESGELVRLTEDDVLTFDELCARLTSRPELLAGMPLYIAGDGTDVAACALSAARIPFFTPPALLKNQHAAAVARCAFLDYKKEGAQFPSDTTISPLYLRVPQAERERLERQAASSEL